VSSRALDDPVLERRRLTALGHIRQFGDPALRTPALEITQFDEALADEAERMTAIMADARGVGLAAPQVGSLRRLVVVRTGDDGEDVVALCNPRITWASEEQETDSEGCLSIGEISVDVARAVAIRVEAQDVRGRVFELEPEGFAARVIQHELDHLDGVLILDRTAPEQRREALRALRDEGL
jgi:peptide deformylase